MYLEATKQNFVSAIFPFVICFPFLQFTQIEKFINFIRNLYKLFRHIYINITYQIKLKQTQYFETKMLNPSMFMKPSNASQQSSNLTKNVDLQKISGLERTRWDEPIQAPIILYQKFKVSPPNLPNLASNQVTNNYPPSLIDFIKRAYSRCKDGPQKKAIQSELREIMQKNKANLNLINWQNHPLPNPGPFSNQQQVRSSVFRQQSRSTAHINQHPMNSSMIGFGNPLSKSNQKQTFMIPTGMYNQSLIEKIQRQSNQTLKHTKQKQIVQQRLQRFAQKFQQSKAQGEEQNNLVPSTKKFIGFKDQKQVQLQKLQQKYQQISDKNKIIQQPRPQPPKQQNLKPTTINSLVSTSNQVLKVVQSRLPEKIYEVKKLPQSVTTSQKKQTKSSKITKKQLQTIVKAGQQEDLKTVAKRFTQFNKIKGGKQVKAQQQAEQEQLDFKMVGKCKQIDKPYLRITHRPDAQTVRPEPILRKAFNHFKGEYKKGVSYELIISQFRSIRQDLTVQNVRNSFTVEVYEQNLKMSLFQDDPIQMKQCQTNLWELYRQGLYNKRAQRTKIISYHFISMILQQRFKELQYMLTLIPSEVLEEKLVQETLRLKRHLVIGNYNAFFNFYTAQDQTCQKLMNYYIDKVRVKCLVVVCKTFGEKISFKQLAQNIAEDEDVLQALAKQQGAIINQGSLMLKQSYEVLKNSEYLQIKKVTSLLD